MLYVMNIYHDSIVDGEGFRTVVFFAGCPHKCKGCHNPQSWNINNGKQMTVEEVFDEVMSNPLSDVTFSGGDPFLQAKEIIPLAKMLKEAGKNIWAYSGFTMEQLMHLNGDTRELLTYIDVLVDGRFILSKRDTSLYWCGSSNQRIIKLENGIITAYCDNKTGEWHNS